MPVLTSSASIAMLYALCKNRRAIVSLLFAGSKVAKSTYDLIISQDDPKAFVSAKKEFLDELFSLVSGIGGNLHANEIQRALDDLPPGQLDQANAHLVRFTGCVLEASLTRLMDDPEFPSHLSPIIRDSDLLQTRLRELRDALPRIPEQWAIYVGQQPPQQQPLAGQDFATTLNRIHSGEPGVEILPLHTLIDFLDQWFQVCVTPLTTRTGLTRALAEAIAPQLGADLSASIATDHPAARAALAKTLLRNQAAFEKDLRSINQALTGLSKKITKTRRTAVKARQEGHERGKVQKKTLSNTKRLLKKADAIVNKLDNQRSSAVTKYRQLLANEYRYIEALHVPEPKDEKLREKWQKQAPLLADAFVPPPCLPQALPLRDFAAACRDSSQPGEDLFPHLAQAQRLVLLADPGMGKTTVIRYLIHTLASVSTGTPLGSDLADYLPVPIILRDLMPALEERERDPERWTWDLLLETWQDWKPARKGVALVSQAFATEEDRIELRELLRGPRAWFLIDGLDEVGSKERRQAMQWVIFQGYAQTHHSARFLVTSRIIGYDEADVDGFREGGSLLMHSLSRSITQDQFDSLIAKALPQRNSDEDDEARQAWAREIKHSRPEFVAAKPKTIGSRSTRTELSTGPIPPLAQVIHLTPFTDRHQQSFASNVFDKRLGETSAQGTTAAFLDALTQHEGVHIISRCPYVLLLLSVVYSEDYRLPSGRARVYARMAEIYLDKINQEALVHPRLGPIAQVPAAKKFEWLEVIAMHMQLRRSGSPTEGDKGKAEPDSYLRATAEDLVAWLRPVIDASGYGGDCQQAALAFAEYLGERTGLFLPRGLELFEWMHNSVMEYFAAGYLKRQREHASQLRDARAAAEDVGQPFHLESYLAQHPPGPVPALPADLRQWATDSSWHEVFIFLAESISQGSNTAPVETLLRTLFPPLYAVGSQAQQAATNPQKPKSPLLSLPAVALAVKLANDRDLALPATTREQWWRTLWRAKWQWPHRLWRVGHEKDWHIAPLLLASPEQQEEVMQQLALAYADLELTALPPGGLALELSDCPTLRSTSLASLQGLGQLKELYLDGCIGLTRTEALAGLGQLEALWMRNCTGLQAAGALQGLAGLGQLKQLYLDGCIGLTQTEALAALKQLEELWLGNCTGLQGASAFQGLAGLGRLKLLSLSGCTGLTQTSVLAGLGQLEELRLNDCTGLQGAGAFQGLAGLGQLKTLFLIGCTGLTQTEALAGLEQLEALWLNKCTGLKGVGALLGLAGLSKLKHLSVRGCTGLTEDDVGWLREQLGARCQVFGPRVG